MSTGGRKIRECGSGVSAREGRLARRAGWVPLPSWWAVLNNTPPGRLHFRIVWLPVQSVRAGGGAEPVSHCGTCEQFFWKSQKCVLIYRLVFIISPEKLRFRPGSWPRILNPSPQQLHTSSGHLDFSTFCCCCCFKFYILKSIYNRGVKLVALGASLQPHPGVQSDL